MEKFFDLHNDFYLKFKDDRRRERYLLKSEPYLKHMVSAVWTSELSAEESMREIVAARDFSADKSKLLLGVEDLHFINKQNLDKFLSLRPFYAGLTWNTCNCLAGGANESGKLTAFGKLVVRALEANHIVLDTAHLNEDSFMGVTRVVSRPIFCSHTACFGVQPASRNLKDYQIRMIVDSGGIMGLCLVSEFLSGKSRATAADVARHIDYFACKFGIDNLSIGTDFYGTSHLPHKIKDYRTLFLSLSAELTKIGYTEVAINKIFYENACRFFNI